MANFGVLTRVTHSVWDAELAGDMVQQATICLILSPELSSQGSSLSKDSSLVE